MKWSIAVLCGALLVPTAVGAEDIGYPHRHPAPDVLVELAPHLGGFLPDDHLAAALGLDEVSDGLFGFSLGAIFSRVIGVEFHLTDVPVSLPLDGIGPPPFIDGVLEGGDILFTDLNLSLTAPIGRAAAAPFFTAGIGRMTALLPFLADPGFTTLNIGGGLRLFPARRVAMRAEARHYRPFLHGDLLNSTHLELGLSVFF